MTERVNAGENNTNYRQFRYDYVAHEDVGQDTFFKSLGVETNLDKLFEGYSTTIFAYGPTGSGKTYTMQGLLEVHGQV